jgi:hypothetical protein
MHRLWQRESARSEISDARSEDFAKLTAAYEPPMEKSMLIQILTDREAADTARTVMLHLVRRHAEL